MTRGARRAWIVGALALAALAALLASADHDDEVQPKRRPTRSRPARVVPLEARAPAPIAGAPCRVEGVITGGPAARVLVSAAAAGIDLEATLAEDGRRFTAELPEQGLLRIVAVDLDGATATASAECGPGGIAAVTLALRPPDGDARARARCVYLETGAPVEGAILRAAPAGGHRGRGERRAAAEPELTALAGAGGEAVLRGPAGRWAIRCERDGEESEPTTVLLQPGREVELELTLAARASVTGRVVGEGGEPIAGATVRSRSATLERGGSGARTIPTGPEGEFLLTGLAPGPVQVSAEHEGAFAEAEVIARTGLPHADVTLTLSTRGLQIRGVVTDPDRAPLAGATVRVIGARGRTGSGSPGLDRAAQTGEDGRFAIGGLAPGGYRVEASAEGYTTGSVAVDDLFTTAEVGLVLARVCEAELRVVPASPPLAVAVYVEGELDAASLSGETGRPLRVEGLHGKVSIYARTEGAVVRSASAAVDLCAARGPIVLELRGGEETGGIEVRVRDGDRRPVAGVSVSLHFRSGITGEAGTVRFEGLAPGEYAARAGEGAPVEVEVEAGRVSTVELTVDRRGGDISGVVAARGRPVEGVAIRAECGDSGGARSLVEAPIVARTGASGAFSFAPSGGDVCSVRAESAELGASDIVTLRAGSLPAWIELAARASISGRVVELATGQPVTPYAIALRPVGRAGALEGRSSWVTEPDGAFRLEGVPPGISSLTVTSERGRAHREVEVAAGEEVRGLELAVFGEGTVRGRVSGPEGPVAGARVSIRRVVGGSFGERTIDPMSGGLSASDGAFELTVPSGDTLRVVVAAAGFYPYGSAPFQLDPTGGPTELGELRLSPRGDDAEKEGGIGIMFSGDPHGVRVIQFTESSPAREAGLELGDVITAIDGTPAGRLPVTSWVVLLRGRPGTQVSLEVERGTDPRFTVSVTRRAIGLPAVPEAP